MHSLLSRTSPATGSQLLLLPLVSGANAFKGFKKTSPLGIWDDCYSLLLRNHRDTFCSDRRAGSFYESCFGRGDVVVQWMQTHPGRKETLRALFLNSTLWMKGCSFSGWGCGGANTQTPLLHASRTSSQTMTHIFEMNKRNNIIKSQLCSS